MFLLSLYKEELHIYVKCYQTLGGAWCGKLFFPLHANVFRPGIAYNLKEETPNEIQDSFACYSMQYEVYLHVCM